VLSPGVETLHWGFSIQYSTLYLTSRFDGGPPKEEPLNQWVPLVEFRFDSPRGQKTAATAGPGFAYVAVTWRHGAILSRPPIDYGGDTRTFRSELSDLIFPMDVANLSKKLLFCFLLLIVSLGFRPNRFGFLSQSEFAQPRRVLADDGSPDGFFN
jgi:hypothetical protein